MSKLALKVKTQMIPVNSHCVNSNLLKAKMDPVKNFGKTQEEIF